MMPEVKICGLRDEAAVDAALIGGARYLGFNFFRKSPRYVDPERAAALAARARGRAEIAAVVVDPDDALLDLLADTLKPDWIQLHGYEPPARATAARRYAGRGVIKAIGIAAVDDLAAVQTFSGAADLILLDAKAPPGAALPGGNGVAFDWAILQGRAPGGTWFLSGGLTPENAGEAARLSRAPVLDVSSGVERAPGVKDPDRIAAFLAAARR